MPFLARRAVVWFSPPKAAFILAPLGAPYLASAAVLHNSRGRSPQPVREASAGPGQNPGSPGPSGPAAPSPLAAKPRQPSGIQVSADSSQRPMTSNVAHSKKALTITVSAFFLISSFLSSRAASSQVLSAFVSLTTVFGMGTGVSSQLSPLNL